MMQFFRKKARTTSRVGIVSYPDQLVVAHVEERDGSPYLLQCERAALESGKDASRILVKLVKDMGLEDRQCSYVLDPKDYNLHLLEAPQVEASELRAAVRWKIKDLLDMKVDDAAIDVFQVPQDAYRGREMVYVVATLKTRIQKIVEMVNASGLELAVIDLPELVLKNVSSCYLDDRNGLAFMDLRRSGSTMNLTHDGDLYLTRRINTQLDQAVMNSADWVEVRDRLVLEIQRSLDYYESQMGKSPITRITIAPRMHDTHEMSKALDELLTAQVSPFNLADFMLADVPLTPELQQFALPAIGATLRGSSKQVKPVAPQPADPAEQEAA